MPLLNDGEIAYAQKLLRLQRERLECNFYKYFPDTGPLRRELYPRSLVFFMAGRLYSERLFLAANRTSKTVSAAYEITAHMTGRYPPWWVGRRFEGPTEWWAAGDTGESTRDIIQREMCGSRESTRNGRWTGMVPGHLIVDRTLGSGLADAVSTIWVEHLEKDHGARCVSTFEMKSYAQGRKSFQGTSKHGVWLDEEPPDATEDASQGGSPSGNGDIYTECLLRTATTGGMIIATFTPLRGLTPFLDDYLSKASMAAVDGTIVNAKKGVFGEEAA